MELKHQVSPAPLGPLLPAWWASGGSSLNVDPKSSPWPLTFPGLVLCSWSQAAACFIALYSPKLKDPSHSQSNVATLLPRALVEVWYFARPALTNGLKLGCLKQQQLLFHSLGG